MTDTPKRKADEAAIQRFVGQLIRNGSLLRAIHGVDQVRRTAETRRSPRIIPGLSIDSLQRERTVFAADEALAALGDLETVSDNTSISRKTGEILRPDFVLFNRVLGKLVLVELKDDETPERQAVTELLAYERELRNHFPFLGQLEIVFVLIAREWTDLLTHAYASLAARGRPALVALTIMGEAPDFHLSVRVEEAWSRLYRLWIDPRALLSQIYQVKVPVRQDERTAFALLSAADLMRQAADHAGQHGFCVMWEEPSDPGHLGIAVYSVDPAHLHVPAGAPDSRRDSEFTDFFTKLLATERIEHNFTIESIFATLRRALPRPVDVELIRNGCWSDDVEWLEQRRVELLEFRYWGMLADFALRIGTSEAALQHYCLGDLPCVEGALAGFQIITAATGSQPFSGGRITAQSLFDLGILLGRAARIASVPEPDANAWRWTLLRLLPHFVELQYLAQSWVNPAEPEEPLRVSSSPDSQSVANVEALKGWIGTILQGDPLSATFEAGWKRERSSEKASEERTAILAEISRDLASAITLSEVRPSKWSSIAIHLPQRFRGLEEPSGVSNVIDTDLTTDSLVKELVEVAELWLEPLKRKQRFIEDVAFDIEDLRRGINDKLAVVPPDTLPCLLIDADGMIGTILAPRPVELAQMDHSKEVGILNRSSGRDLLTIVGWDDVADGSFRVISEDVLGLPIALEEWRSDGQPTSGNIDNRWHGQKINLSNHGLVVPGPPGARFLQLTLSENMPSELAFVVNTSTPSGDGLDWSANIHFVISTGAIKFEGAQIGFIAMKLVAGAYQESHPLFFDPCDRHAKTALDCLSRQLHVHIVVADEAGQTLAFQAVNNDFKFDRVASLALRLSGGSDQQRATFLIRHRSRDLCQELVLNCPDLLR